MQSEFKFTTCWDIILCAYGRRRFGFFQQVHVRVEAAVDGQLLHKPTENYSNVETDYAMAQTGKESISLTD